MILALAAIARWVELGSLVRATPVRGAALPAKTADSVDGIGGGRPIHSLDAGRNEGEDRVFGVPSGRRGAHFAGACSSLGGLLGGVAGDLGGACYQARGPRCARAGCGRGGPRP